MSAYNKRVKSVVVIDGKEIPVLQKVEYIYSKADENGFVAFTEINSETDEHRLVLINPTKVDYIKSTEWQQQAPMSDEEIAKRMMR